MQKRVVWFTAEAIILLKECKEEYVNDIFSLPPVIVLYYNFFIFVSQ
jgi:hypothetical protein